jgi:hypothetical protein
MMECLGLRHSSLIVELESKIKLALVIASLLGVVYGLIMGDLWPAAACAISAICVSVSYRRAARLS